MPLFRKAGLERQRLPSHYAMKKERLSALFLMVSDDIQLSHQCVLQYLTEIHMGGQSLIV